MVHFFEGKVKVDEFLQFEGDHWMVKEVGVDLNYIKRTGALLTDELSYSRLKEEVSNWEEEEWIADLPNNIKA